MVFIHGLGVPLPMNIPALSVTFSLAHAEPILIDLPGSGYSDKPRHYSYHTTDQARVVAELIDHLELDAFWLYGHSMGGSIAIETAAMLGTRVKGLMVSEPNFHAGGGMFSRSIAAQTEQQFLEQGYDAMLSAGNLSVGGVSAKQCAVCSLARSKEPG